MTATMEELEKLDIRIATITGVRDHPNADKLLLLDVYFGEGDERQIVAGIKEDYEKSDLLHSQIPVVANMEPIEIRGEQSNGMLLAVNGDEIALLNPDKICEPGVPVE
ncbi:MAG: hypothetical protein ABEJ65_11085 [bacterium]